MNDPQFPVADAYLARPASRLLDDFGAGKASPGSGSAAALMGLLAVKLIRTVCMKSLEKEQCRAARPTLEHVLEQVTRIEPTLVDLFEKDAREFEEVVKLRVERDVATSPEDRMRLTRRANALLETATDNAFAIIDACLPLIGHGVQVFQVGWGAVRGDSGAAISSAIAAVMSAIFITNLNLKSLGGRRYARDNIVRCADFYAKLQERQASAFQCVTSLNAEALEAVQLELFEAGAGMAAAPEDLGPPVEGSGTEPAADKL
ncbi:cyclodeaminase/cyclohydrolase family protein [Cupriavidus gilardii]|uniref:cyclodeaminase/cyclohydrolase family protein n=1 Tax=Cupriavidus gilardii TaxID=82541 RepID=UPI0015733527|nr:cyclodeaminase/cyclohydrolase family protein [Cupriavidus gilardii]NSX02753.1 cyclodeaminase/cyclohydrolase family protein [Cupriavidus gilardii]